MTPEELVAEHLKETEDPSRLYEDAVSIPEVIHRFVSLLRKLCELGQRIPPLVVLVKTTQEDGYGPYLQNLIFPEAKNLHVQCLTVQVSGTLQLLRDYQECFRLSEAEGALYLAAHELRHCLQTRRKVEAYRGTGWLENWALRHCPSLCDALMTCASTALRGSCKHALTTLPMGKTRKGRQRSIMLECDADITAIACVTSARLNNTLEQIARLLHG